MSTAQNSPIHLTAGEAFSVAFLRVKAGGRTAQIADASDYGIGVNINPVADGAEMAVRLYAEGSCKMVTSGTIIAGRKVYAAAGGKIASSGTKLIGTALDAASGNNSVIEVLPHCGLLQSSSSSSSSSESSSSSST